MKISFKLSRAAACFVMCSFPLATMSGCCCSGGCCGKKTVKRVEQKAPASSADIKAVIQQEYGKVADEGGMCCLGGGCCGGGAALSEEIGYSREEMDALADANLGLGCGNPVSFAPIKSGSTVVDLGSGAGFDCFLAARKVGESGLVIGIDMTKKMIAKARANAVKYGYENAEFRLGDIENMPVATGTVDVVISNCVINLAPDKMKVFREIHRILKQNGAMAISDVVLTGLLTPEQKRDTKLLCACVSGAISKQEYIDRLTELGFKVTIVDEDFSVNEKWFGTKELPISSLKFIAIKE